MKLHCSSMKYGAFTVFGQLDFEPETEKITCVLGASGCGKTTLLNMIGGLVPFEGERDFPDRISYVFQTPRLIPALTVYRNLDYVLGDIRDKGKRQAAIRAVLSTMELSAYENSYPAELSGGMAQRVSMARAFCYKAPLLLMDEPFQALDIKLKDKLMREFLALRRADGRTVVFVTHDVDEAVALADRIVVLGSPPSGIALDLAVPVPQPERTLRNPELTELRARIHECLLGE